jgi:hypothetical protein
VVKVLLWFGCASRNSNIERTLFYVDTGQESLKNACVRENMQSRQKIIKTTKESKSSRTALNEFE